MKSKFDSDFSDFVSSSNHHSPSHIDRKILRKIKQDLNPNKLSVFGKLVLIQAFVGIITMLFCPQFNMSLTSNDELFHYFHRNFGLYGCMAACGVLFLGSGALFASQILRYSELALIARSRFLFSFAIVGTAILGFIFVGADVYSDLTLAWVAGGLIGQLFTMEVNFLIRSTLINKKAVS